LDVGKLPTRTGEALAATGMDLAALSRIAGRDGVISTAAEYNRLFDLLDRLDRNGSRQSIDTSRSQSDGTTRPTLSGEALGILMDEVQVRRRTSHVGGAAGMATEAPPSGTRSAPWLDIAKGELGQAEVAGRANNPRIVEYGQSVRGHITSDETRWCSTFANWVMQKAGIPGTGSAAALSWLKWGRELPAPAVGSLAVIDWGNNKGHVGFVVGRSGDCIVLAGGNQHDQVRYTAFRLNQIASFRVPDGYEVPPEDFKLPAMNVKIANETIASTT
jgi:uncharacterized protein (TIGR02594 family)